MKKKLLIGCLVICLSLISALVLVSCNLGKGEIGDTSSTDIVAGIQVIVKGNKDTPNYYSCIYDTTVGNKEAFTLSDVKVYYLYRNGKSKELKKDEYFYRKYDTDGNISFSTLPFAFMEHAETSASVPGRYKMRFSTVDKKYTADLIIDIFKQKLDYDFNLNKYTNNNLTEFSIVDAQQEKIVIPFAQQYKRNYEPYFFTAQVDGIKSTEFSFVITPALSKFLELEIAQTENWINNNIVGFVENGLCFNDKKGFPLYKGEYFVFAKYNNASLGTMPYSYPIRIIIESIKSFQEYSLDERVVSIYVPSDVIDFEKGFLDNCTNLRRIMIHHSETDMEKYNLSRFALEYASVPASVIPYLPRSLKEIHINSGEHIRDNAFQAFPQLTTVRIGDSVTDIGAYAFYNCKALTSVEMGRSVSKIGSKAFGHCESLTSIEIGSSVTIIGSYAFSDCDSLDKIVIPESVEMIGVGAFSYATNLKELVFSDGLNWYQVKDYSDWINKKNGKKINLINFIDNAENFYEGNFYLYKD